MIMGWGLQQGLHYLRQLLRLCRSAKSFCLAASCLAAPCALSCATHPCKTDWYQDKAFPQDLLYLWHAVRLLVHCLHLIAALVKHVHQAMVLHACPCSP